ncbi:signal peptide peptidase SppA [Mycolicibacter hiberniae]|uniref:Signal peptide peptidase SppA n=1 Tax=Mycolicibacter hiberniae TaxID=29314 RepID=A0A7I7X648_9MYCO|nr:signal peptide peptidase SppA [Mycolicibacter hiberniae]MCV7084604.1 signal peptide peptidase SppA [Mycolicibacter hiberniae]ORV66543.1 signal peptide peptidase SppA [Mycolicibacter hiberniae]BBZ24327.1 signal peptide peptidase SppA [Mycolicibacter hiberniae]
MFSLLPGVPGIDGLRGVARRLDTARHHGVPNGVILELDLQELPHETSAFDPLALIRSGGRPPVLRDVVAAIHRAAQDPRVAGLIARVQLSAAAAGPVQELRAAVAEFTAVKPSVAWAETYPGTLSYYLASAFGEIWMQPSGTVGLVGFATSATFLRTALDKAGIEAQFVARGEYKSAANLFTQDSYTDAHREADTALVQSLHAQVRAAVAESRKLDAGVVDALADKAPLLRDDAQRSGLIDRIGFRDQAYDRITELTGAGDIAGADDDDAPPRLYLTRYAHATTPGSGPPLPGRKPKPVVAVVTVAGAIVSGSGGPPLSPLGNRSVGGDTIAAALREAAADDDVAAIVLRVDSPGGSVTGSETIWRAVQQARAAGKPVVASMGAVAASGGYYISAGTDAIVANPGTITGSIGVVTGKLVTRALKDRLGVGSDAVRTGANADAWSMDAPFTAEQQGQVETEADLFYDDFVARVAQGRNLSTEEVDAVARGRVWTGADAAERGLVDELGGLRTAVRRAKVLAGLDADAQVRTASYPGSSWWEFIRPRPSSQPAAAVSAAVGGLVVRSLVGVVEHIERSVNGAHVLWLGESRW